jgi:hypothetical protein
MEAALHASVDFTSARKHPRLSSKGHAHITQFGDGGLTAQEYAPTQEVQPRGAASN